MLDSRPRGHLLILGLLLPTGESERLFTAIMSENDEQNRGVINVVE